VTSPAYLVFWGIDDKPLWLGWNCRSGVKPLWATSLSGRQASLGDEPLWAASLWASGDNEIEWPEVAWWFDRNGLSPTCYHPFVSGLTRPSSHLSTLCWLGSCDCFLRLPGAWGLRGSLLMTAVVYVVCFFLSRCFVRVVLCYSFMWRGLNCTEMTELELGFVWYN
jgi:hypothetical protein